MKSFVALTTLTAAIFAQTPAGCATNFKNTFVLEPLDNTSAPKQVDNQRVRTICGAPPVVTLQDGSLIDQDNRAGLIDVNAQLRFNNPVPETYLFLGGFSICENGSLAVAGSTIFYQCLNCTTISNLYQQNQGGQCNEIYIYAISCESDPNATPDSVSASGVSSVPAPTTSTTPRSSTETLEAAISTTREGILGSGQAASATITSKHDEVDSTPSAALPVSSATDRRPIAEKGFSSAAKAGLGIGAVLTAILICGMLYSAYRKRRQWTQSEMAKDNDAVHEPRSDTTEPPQAYTYMTVPQNLGYSLDSRSILEPPSRNESRDRTHQPLQTMDHGRQIINNNPLYEPLGSSPKPAGERITNRTSMSKSPQGAIPEPRGSQGDTEEDLAKFEQEEFQEEIERLERFRRLRIRRAGVRQRIQDLYLESRTEGHASLSMQSRARIDGWA